MHRFFMHEHANPNPVYYEDLIISFTHACAPVITSEKRIFRASKLTRWKPIQGITRRATLFRVIC